MTKKGLFDTNPFDEEDDRESGSSEEDGGDGGGYSWEASDGGDDGDGRDREDSRDEGDEDRSSSPVVQSLISWDDGGRDPGDEFGQQSQETQDAFRSAYGDDAESRWQDEHRAELERERRRDTFDVYGDREENRDGGSGDADSRERRAMDLFGGNAIFAQSAQRTADEGLQQPAGQDQPYRAPSLRDRVAGLQPGESGAQDPWRVPDDLGNDLKSELRSIARSLQAAVAGGGVDAETVREQWMDHLDTAKALSYARQRLGNPTWKPTTVADQNYVRRLAGYARDARLKLATPGQTPETVDVNKRIADTISAASGAMSRAMSDRLGIDQNAEIAQQIANGDDAGAPWIKEIAGLAWARQNQEQGTQVSPGDVPADYVDAWERSWRDNVPVPFGDQLDKEMAVHGIDKFSTREMEMARSFRLTPEQEAQRAMTQMARAEGNIRMAQVGDAGTIMLMSSSASSLRPDLAPNQDQSWRNGELTYDEAMAACGPGAAIAFARATGRNPTWREAVTLARQVGWTPDSGMRGPASEVALLEKLGIRATLEETVNFKNVDAAIAQGAPVIMDTMGSKRLPAGHYFVLYGKQGNNYLVGGSGSGLRGGADWMTLDEMAVIAGKPRSAIYMNPRDVKRAVAMGPDDGGASMVRQRESAERALGLPEAIDAPTREERIDQAVPIARMVERETGVPADLMVALSVLETNGLDPKEAPGNAYHGIQAQAGEPGTEYTDYTAEGKPYRARLKAFGGPYEAYKGFARFLLDNPRYKAALQRYEQTGSSDQLLADIKAAGYAEDPQYVAKVANIMRNQVRPRILAAAGRAG
ncbi:MAG: glucosaminidase domain-containing protein [Chloroflexota bacterium]